MTIYDNDVSIVVQGPIIPELTSKCIRSIRRNFPNSEIILSTWSGSDISEIDDVNEIIFNNDPGAPYNCYITNSRDLSKPNNINRQIISTQSGISLASRKYILKTRTDFEFTSNAILRKYNYFILKFPDRDNKWIITKERILTVGTGNVRTMFLAYHLSDLLMIGTNEDLREFWNIPLIDQYDANYCYINKISQSPWYFNFRYATEQYILLKNIIKHENIYCRIPENHFEINSSIISDSENILLNNFYFLSYCESGIKSKFEYLIYDRFAYFTYDFIFMYYLKFLKHGIIQKISLTYYKLINQYQRLICMIQNKHGIEEKIKLIIKIILKTQKAYLSSINKRLPIFSKLFNLNYFKNVIYNNRIMYIDNHNNEIEVNGIPGISIKLYGNNNTIRIMSRGPFFNSEIFVDGNDNYIEIGRNTHYIGNTKIFVGNGYYNRRLSIGNNAMIMGLELFLEENNGRITIGNDLTCSDHVTIQNSDGHVIYDEDSRHILNKGNKNIDIGNNVWLGRKSSILKNSYISNGSIVAFGAIVTGEFPNENCLIAGVPAKEKRSGIKWTREMFNQFKEGK